MGKDGKCGGNVQAVSTPRQGGAMPSGPMTPNGIVPPSLLARSVLQRASSVPPDLSRQTGQLHLSLVKNPSPSFALLNFTYSLGFQVADIY